MRLPPLLSSLLSRPSTSMLYVMPELPPNETQLSDWPCDPVEFRVTSRAPGTSVITAATVRLSIGSAWTSCCCTALPRVDWVVSTSGETPDTVTFS